MDEAFAYGPAMTKVSIRAHRLSVVCAVAAVVSLGSSPLQAFAADGMTDAVSSTTIDSLIHLAVGGKPITVGKEVARHVWVVPG